MNAKANYTHYIWQLAPKQFEAHTHASFHTHEIYCVHVLHAQRQLNTDTHIHTCSNTCYSNNIYTKLYG